jgi:DNA polymerase I-like protein with 3'-5' exonuclease and polymerase domains
MRGTYIEGFKPHADGCVHTTFTFDTGIGQLSSRNPNIQNFPKHGRLAKATRRMIAAKPGHILTEWDYKSCHVLTLGFLAEDANYIRCARIDMHSIVTGHKLGLWHAIELLRDYDDDAIRAKCKWLKSNPEWKHIRDARMKHAILGIGNGLKARGLYEKHMEDFSGVKEAQQFLDVVEELFPRVFEWHTKVQKLAHEQQFQKTQYGHMRRFYEVFVWNYKKAAYGHGDQAEEAISYWLSNIAFGYIREHMKLLERAGLNEKYGLCNNVHDSLMFHFPATMLDEHVREVYPLLIQPSKVLTHPTICPDGLWIDAECNAGRDWSAMEEIPVKGVLLAQV